MTGPATNGAGHLSRRLHGASTSHQWRRREQPIAQAAGPLPRRLQCPSTIRVDFGCVPRTPVHSANGGNCRRQNALAPEVARHQQVSDHADFAFKSRIRACFSTSALGRRQRSGQIPAPPSRLPTRTASRACGQRVARRLATSRPRRTATSNVLVEFEAGRTPGLGFFAMQDELSQMFGRVVDLQTRASRHFRDAVPNQHVAA